MHSTDVSWEDETRADAGRLWAGGAVTALVAAGVALVAVLVMQRLLDVTVRTPDGDLTSDAMTVLPIGAAVVALLATGLLHLLMSFAPRAPHFFGWIGGLVLTGVLLVVFINDTKLITRVETVAFYLLIGIVIISSLLGVAHTAVRYHRHQNYRDHRNDYPNEYPPEGGYRRPGYPPEGGHQPQGYPPEPGYSRYR
jgi:amino acid transporter